MATFLYSRWPNKAAAGNGAMTPLFNAERPRRAVPAQRRWTTMLRISFAILAVLLGAKGSAHSQPMTNGAAVVQTNSVTVTSTPSVSKEMEELKARLKLLRPSMTVQEAEAALGLPALTAERMVAHCSGYSIFGNYRLTGGKRLFLWWQPTYGQFETTRAQLISATLSDEAKPEGQADFCVWVKPQYEFFAELQTNWFAGWRAQALEVQEPDTIVTLLEFVLEGYPGAQQVPGSPLDKAVQRNRGETIDDILGHLRKTTGKDLGSEPQKWIERYKRKP